MWRKGIIGKRALSVRDERGVILVVVLGVLQLLALIGMTFALFASHGGPVDAIGRVEQDIHRAEARSRRSSRIRTTRPFRSRRS